MRTTLSLLPTNCSARLIPAAPAPTIHRSAVMVKPDGKFSAFSNIYSIPLERFYGRSVHCKRASHPEGDHPSTHTACPSPHSPMQPFEQHIHLLKGALHNSQYTPQGICLHLFSL